MMIESPHFGEIQITGEDASSVADWLKSELSEATNSHVAQKENILHSLL